MSSPFHLSQIDNLAVHWDTSLSVNRWMSKAFNLLDQGLLLNKLKQIGVPEQAVGWSNEYLSN